MRYLETIIVILLITHSAVFAQNRKTFTFSGGIGHAWALYDKGDFGDNRAGQMQMTDVNFKTAYYIAPRFALGMGFSSGSYYKADVSILAFNLNMQYDINPRLFTAVDFGVPLGDDGTIVNLGLGYRVLLWKNRCSLNAALAYRMMDYSGIWYETDYMRRSSSRFNHSLLLSVSFEYAFTSAQPQTESALEQDEYHKHFWLMQMILVFFDIVSRGR